LYKNTLLSANDITSLPSVISHLLQDFKDVFPEETPTGLPPLQGIEHQIDLIPGAALPNRPPYRTNPEETKEIRSQVQALLDKGYVRESLIPCAVPIILVPKKDGTWMFSLSSLMSMPDEEFDVLGEDKLALLMRRFERLHEN
jgi:hypothetical protein